MAPRLPDRADTVRRGFDEFFGFLGGAHSYLPGTARGGQRRRNAAGPPSGTILRGTEPVDEKEYLTDAFAREAVSFVERHRNGPFFLYLPFNAVHAPLEAPESSLSRFSSIEDPTRRTFAAMLSAMDDAVGRVLDTLRAGGLDENTLIVFHSDNGGPTPQTSSRNDPLRGTKGQVFEGGMRVPFLAQWKGRLSPGKVYDAPVIALDIHPTAVAAAGGTIPKEAKLDGVDLVPFLTGARPGRPHESLCWRMGEQWAIRKGDLKLVAARGASPQLYDLATDVGESKELTSARPEAAKDLRAAYEAWDRGNVPPRWQRPPRAAAQPRQRRRNAPQQ